MRRANPRTLAAIALGLLVLIAAALLLSRPSGKAPQDRLSDKEAGGTGDVSPDTRCASQATYDRVKAELFRQAALTRRSDQAAFERLSAYASVRMERPVLRSRDAELGTIRCAGRLSIDLPPGVAVVGGRQSLSADIDYVLQPAADGTGDVVLLEGADPIVIPLATLARSGETGSLPVTPPADPQQPSAPDSAAGQVPPAPIPTYPPGQPSAESPEASANPSFNCRHARTKGEIAVCGDDGLASLDRQMAGQYFRALASAGPRQRALLTRTRDDFLRYRDRCPNSSCIAETYRGRMREIRDIMAGTWRPER